MGSLRCGRRVPGGWGTASIAHGGHGVVDGRVHVVDQPDVDFAVVVP
jgi:hypothetical protein